MRFMRTFYDFGLRTAGSGLRGFGLRAPGARADTSTAHGSYANFAAPTHGFDTSLVACRDRFPDAATLHEVFNAQREGHPRSSRILEIAGNPGPGGGDAARSHQGAVHSGAQP